MTRPLPSTAPRRLASLAAGLALMAGCSTPARFSARDIQALSPQGQAFVVAAAEICRVKPPVIMASLANRPQLSSIVIDMKSGDFAAVFLRNPSSEQPERVILTSEELLRPERLKPLEKAMQRPGLRCADAVVDFQNALVANRLLDLLRRMPERPDDEAPPWLNPKPMENSI